jgi:hypothetical protein
LYSSAAVTAIIMVEQKQNTATALRWYQTKRIPLWIAVAATVTAAGTYFISNRKEAEISASQRKDSLPDERAAGHTGEGTKGVHSHESAARDTMRQTGLMEGQETHGIFPNKAIAKGLSNIIGNDEGKK